MTTFAALTQTQQASLNELSAYIKANNSANAMFTVVSDPEYWADCGIFTIEEYEHSMASSSYSDIYKEEFGVRPRHIDFDAMTADQVWALVDELCQQSSGSIEDEEEVEYSIEEALGEYIPNNPFAILKKIV